MLFQIFTFAVTLGALVAGIFGMNLFNGHESADDGWFEGTVWAVVVGVICIGCLLSTCAMSDLARLT
jgi:Mg2+ and Co2+ transporter CorA